MTDAVAPSRPQIGQAQNKVNIDGLLPYLQVAGLGKDKTHEWKMLLRLCSNTIPRSYGIAYMSCQFNTCPGRVQVCPRDFGLAAKLDSRALLALRIRVVGRSANAVTFDGRNVV